MSSLANVLAWAMLIAPAADEKIALSIDFDGPGKSTEGWTVKGKIEASGVTADPSGKAMARHLAIDAMPGTMLRTTTIKLPDFTTCSDVEFRVRSESATASDPTVLEVQFYVPKRGRFWRKVEVRSSEFTTVRLPLRWFRASTGSVPRWSEVTSLGFWFRNGGKVAIDEIKLFAGKPGATELDPDEIAEAAFGTETEPKRFTRGPFVILSDDDALVGEEILDALSAMEGSVRRDFPKGEKPWHPVVLLMFARDADYRAFWPRFMERFGSDAPTPENDGWTAMGIASSASGDVPLRPVFVHEAAHALLEQVLRIDNQTNWLQEGLAVRYQSEFMQTDFGPAMRTRVAQDATQGLRLARLTDGDKIDTSKYAQAGSFIEWAFADPKRADGFRRAINEMSTSASTKLEPHAQSCFGAPIDVLESQWLDWAKARYAAGKPDEKPDEKK